MLSADIMGGGDGSTAALIVSLDSPTGVLFWDLHSNYRSFLLFR